MKPVNLTLSMALVLGLSATAASAQDVSGHQVCMPAEEMKASLVDWYGETPVAEPSQEGEQMWASDRTGTWTMVRLLADGNACVVAQGENWMAGVDSLEKLALLTD
ncbi:S-adenosyl-L-homocysteine hydrolase [Sulfitobacter sp. EhC04]|uniref:S-adenosyl-L-homocysteine hydrolase n=1 Tax=Sulfitobacter sp. EhC04 TaxID=1849168 RepID=UPI0007F4FE2D|nr:S-adenosyl-L-homocysteine hydrolase [Sulfitobacter sp. EhC04]OAN67619.1 S-adenosyl-L-homocysteine hydrolase [Sulfitobacter sp. EhC04]